MSVAAVPAAVAAAPLPPAPAEEHEALLQFLYHAPIGLVQTERGGQIQLANPVAARLLMPLAGDGALDNVFDALGTVAPDLRHRVDAFAPARGLVCENLRVPLRAGDGDPMNPSVLALTAVRLDPARLMFVLQDITVTVRREHALRDRDAWFNAVLTGIRDYALVPLDAEGRISRWNESIGRVIGHGEQEVVGRPFTSLEPGETLTGHAIGDRLREADANGWTLEEGWRLRADGSRFWASALLAPLGRSADGSPDPRAYSLILRDISDKREASEALRRAVRCDHLTGLLNRRAFFDGAAVEIERRWRQARALSLVMFDVDHFKRVNDAHGHPAGDAVLRRVGELLASSFRAVDLVARMGGEEFAVLMPAASTADASRVAERCLARIAAEVVAFAGGSTRVTVSAGIAAMDDAIADLDALLRAADRALYRAKANGRNRVDAEPTQVARMRPDAAEAQDHVA